MNMCLRVDLDELRDKCMKLRGQARAAAASAALSGQLKDEIIRTMTRQLKQAKAKVNSSSL